MVKIYKSNIQKVEEQPFHLLADLDDEELKVAIKDYKNKSGWLIPQTQALLNKELKLLRGENGLISPTLVITELIKGKNEEQKAWWRGLLAYINYAPRGAILGSDNSPQKLYPSTSALVPLVLYTFKRDRGVQYDEWDWNDKNISFLVDADLLAALDSEWFDASKEDWLKWREIACTISTGKDAGTLNSPVDVYKRTTIKGEGMKPFNDLSRLAQIMLMQLHVAHPSIRKDYMILSKDFDIPESLIDEEIVISTPSIKKIKDDSIWH